MAESAIDWVLKDVVLREIPIIRLGGHLKSGHTGHRKTGQRSAAWDHKLKSLTLPPRRLSR